MTAEENLAVKIQSAGSAGVKKADLRKEYGDIESSLESLLTKGEIFVEKRSTAYYCYHKDFYLQSLLNSDPKFRLTYDMIKSLEETVSRSSKDVTLAVELLANNISNLARLVTETAAASPPRKSISLDAFREAFDGALVNSASSIGWVELAKVRNEVCSKCQLTAEEFYSLAGKITTDNQDKYELSTGGQEGVMVRGLVHGFVRCI